MSNAYRSVLASGGVTPTGDAVAADVLAGKTFSNANAVGVTGTMVNRGAVNQTIQPGGSYTIPEGYHNGNGIVSASEISSGDVLYSNQGTGPNYTTTESHASILVITSNLAGSGGGSAPLNTTATDPETIFDISVPSGSATHMVMKCVRYKNVASGTSFSCSNSTQGCTLAIIKE